jgi:phage baseplate assembly protein V
MDSSKKNKTGDDNWFRNMVRIGYVSSQHTDDTQGACRVVYPDRSDLVSDQLPVIQKSTKGNNDYWTPEPGEQVLTLHLPNGIHKGFILGSFHSTSAPPPVTDTNKRHTTFADGSTFEFDKASSVLFINTKGPITIITSGPVHLEGSDISIKGNILLDGPVHIKGDITHEGNMNTSGVHTDSIGRHDA